MSGPVQLLSSRSDTQVLSVSSQNSGEHSTVVTQNAIDFSWMMQVTAIFEEARSKEKNDALLTYFIKMHQNVGSGLNNLFVSSFNDVSSEAVTDTAIEAVCGSYKPELRTESALAVYQKGCKAYQSIWKRFDEVSKVNSAALRKHLIDSNFANIPILPLIDLIAEYAKDFTLGMPVRAVIDPIFASFPITPIHTADKILSHLAVTSIMNEDEKRAKKEEMSKRVNRVYESYCMHMLATSYLPSQNSDPIVLEDKSQLTHKRDIQRFKNEQLKREGNTKCLADTSMVSAIPPASDEVYILPSDMEAFKDSGNSAVQQLTFFDANHKFLFTTAPNYPWFTLTDALGDGPLGKCLRADSPKIPAIYTQIIQYVDNNNGNPHVKRKAEPGKEPPTAAAAASTTSNKRLKRGPAAAAATAATAATIEMDDE